MSELLLDRAWPTSIAGNHARVHAGRPPRNKGLRYPADPPKVEKIIAVMRAAGDRRTAAGSAAWSSSCGAQGYASRSTRARRS
jgi:hypothetical protein